MDKKCSLIIALLAGAGAAVAGLLTYSHYNPGVTQQFVVCGGGIFAGDCDALNRWAFATIFRVPLAGYGLFMFVMVMATALSAFYAGGAYANSGMTIILCLSILILITDICLAGVMLVLKTVCTLCLTTYAINLLVLLTAWLWYKHKRNQTQFSLRESLRALLPRGTDSSEKRASAVLYVMLAFMVFFSVFATAQYLQARNVAMRTDKEMARHTVEAFFQQQPEKLVLPPSSLMIGNDRAQVKIVAFTDFLCTACATFYQREKDLIAKYGDKISVAYYNYPLDTACNSGVPRTEYPDACVAAKAALAAANLKVFPDYLQKHYARYKEFHGQYNLGKALEAANGLADGARFKQELDADAVKQTLQRDIELGKNLKIDRTPTIFINGRRMAGVPSREIMEMVVERELKTVAK